MGDHNDCERKYFEDKYWFILLAIEVKWSIIIIIIMLMNSQLMKKYFYCANTSYPMDNCFTGRRDRSRQMPEKDVLYIVPAGPVSSVHSLGGASHLLPV